MVAGRGRGDEHASQPWLSRQQAGVGQGVGLHPVRGMAAGRARHHHDQRGAGGTSQVLRLAHALVEVLEHEDGNQCQGQARHQPDEEIADRVGVGGLGRRLRSLDHREAARQPVLLEGDVLAARISGGILAFQCGQCRRRAARR